MSVRASRSPSAIACSGLMYPGDPIGWPAWVSVRLPAALMARAMPKSATIACVPESRMFSGLMSRWMIPCPWAKARASATSRAMWSASSSGSLRSRSKRCRSDSPSTYGMT